MKTKYILGVLGLILAGSSALQAQQLAQSYPYQQPVAQPYPQPLVQEPAGGPRFEISPFYGYRFGGAVQNPLTGRTYEFRDSEAYGLFLDMAPRPNWPVKFELLWSRQDSSVNLQGLGGLGRVNLTIDEIQIGGSLERGGPASPRVCVAAGRGHVLLNGRLRVGHPVQLRAWRRSEVFYHPQPGAPGRPSRLLHHRGFRGRPDFQRRRNVGCLLWHRHVAGTGHGGRDPGVLARGHRPASSPANEKKMKNQNQQEQAEVTETEKEISVYSITSCSKL